MSSNMGVVTWEFGIRHPERPWFICKRPWKEGPVHYGAFTSEHMITFQTREAAQEFMAMNNIQYGKVVCVKAYKDWYE